MDEKPIPEDCEEMPDEALLRVARIIGPNSASLAVLNERNRRYAAGEEDVAVYWSRRERMYIIGPRAAILSHPGG